MNVQNLKKLTKPTAPVTLAQVKEFLRIDHSDEDTTLMMYVKAATNRLETLCDTVFVETQFLFTLDEFPYTSKEEWWDGVRDGIVGQHRNQCNFIQIPVGAIRSVDLFTFTDSAGTTSNVDSTTWKLDNVRSQGRISLNFGAVWPSAQPAANNAVQITFKAGLVSDPTQLPEEIQIAVLQLTAQLYERRGDELPEIPSSCLMLLEPYRRFKV